MYAVAYDTHPNEETGREVAQELSRRPIMRIKTVQANVLAAAQTPPVRYIDEELTYAFGSGRNTCEGRRSRELPEIYRQYNGVIDIHNNATNRQAYGMCGPDSHPVVLSMASVLGLLNIVVMDSELWPGYEYFERCPNLLVVEGFEGPGYDAQWWRAGLSVLGGLPAGWPEPREIRFFRRLPDITWAQARAGEFSLLPWEASFYQPLPMWVEDKLRIGRGHVYALSWPNGDRAGYAPPELDYFGEIVQEIPNPASGDSE